MTFSQFSFPTAITFGPGARTLVLDHLRAHGVERPLVVTDRGVGALPIFTDLIANLDDPSLDVREEAVSTRSRSTACGATR